MRTQPRAVADGAVVAGNAELLHEYLYVDELSTDALV